jgi:putative ABC transport system substrate-binding protein
LLPISLALGWKSSSHRVMPPSRPQWGQHVYSSEVRAVEDIASSFTALMRAKAEALLVFNDTITVAGRKQILDLAARQRIPAMYEASEWAEVGGLAAYGVTHADLFRQSASHVARILKGAKPADIPVEQPTLLRLAINLTTARSLNLAIPPSVLLRSDRVIE